MIGIASEQIQERYPSTKPQQLMLYMNAWGCVYYALYLFGITGAPCRFSLELCCDKPQLCRGRYGSGCLPYSASASARAGLAVLRVWSGGTGKLAPLCVSCAESNRSNCTALHFHGDLKLRDGDKCDNHHNTEGKCSHGTMSRLLFVSSLVRPAVLQRLAVRRVQQEHPATRAVGGCCAGLHWAGAADSAQESADGARE